MATAIRLKATRAQYNQRAASILSLVFSANYFNRFNTEELEDNKYIKQIIKALQENRTPPIRPR